ncbi:MAG: hypothetical protein D6705_07700 [Deltaproteobacteria bacterium]|nr:MAG: hypothetical protein D6705_07700 [Deltaproteobacteria bacterium]
MAAATAAALAFALMAPRPGLLPALWAALLVPAWAGVALGIVDGGSPGKRWAFGTGLLLLVALPAAEFVASRLGVGSVSPAVGRHLPSLYTALSLLGGLEIADRIRRRIRLARALRTAEAELARDGEVWIFGGPPEGDGPVVPAPLGTDGPRVEVLPEAELFVRGPSGMVPRLSLAPIRRLAPARLFALRVPIPGARAEDPNLRVHRRSLSPAERSELSGQAERLRRRLGPVLSSYLACGLQILADAFVWGRSGEELWFSAGTTFWYAVAAATSIAYVGRIRAAHRLERDAGHPWVVTIENADTAMGDVPHMEVLPVSRLLWTERGRPAAWRLHRP